MKRCLRPYVSVLKLRYILASHPWAAGLQAIDGANSEAGTARLPAEHCWDGADLPIMLAREPAPLSGHVPMAYKADAAPMPFPSLYIPYMYIDRINYDSAVHGR